MLHRLSGLLLLLSLGLAHVETTLALACEPQMVTGSVGALPAQGGHTHCPPEEDGRPSRDGAPRHTVPHGGPSCASMLACGILVALPAPPLSTVGPTMAIEKALAHLLPPPSRTDAPANPPPRA